MTIQSAITTKNTGTITLPPIDSPALNTAQPSCSYKISFQDNSAWYASTDGGKTMTSTGHPVVAGCPLDLVLQLSKGKQRADFDQRLRLAFLEPDGGQGTLCELNINAVSISRDGNPYVTSPARSLVGALLAISDSADDMEAFTNGARFRLKPGTGAGLFIECDINVDGRWVAMASPAATLRVPKDVPGFHSVLAQIKQDFTSAGLLLSAAAITGMLDEYAAASGDDFQAIPVVAEDVEQLQLAGD